MVKIDFRLFQVAVELQTLQEHLDTIEEQVVRGERAAKSALDLQLSDLGPHDDGEWRLARDEYDFQVKVVLPRTMRNPFLVSLFAVYESSVREIAGLLQRRKDIRISIDDLKGSFLDRSEMYYNSVLYFNLTTDPRSIESLRVLSRLRNAVAHRNGRVDIDRDRESLLRVKGVVREYDFMIVDQELVQELFLLVKTELEGLVSRYKAWDAADTT